jgi:hypothetical protein
MMQIKRLTKSSDTKIYCYERENYTKPIICNICKCKINNKTWSIHIKSENHKLAEQLHSISIKPIEDIKKTILEYKMLQKYQKRQISDCNSSTTSTVENVDLISSDEQPNKKPITIEKIRCKTEIYARQLAIKSERYEKTKAISKLVYAIQNSTKRLTNLQKEKYNYLLNKYPDNELLLSIKHLVPETEIKAPMERTIKPYKKKSKTISYPIIEYKEDNKKVSYPIIEYKETKVE